MPSPIQTGQTSLALARQFGIQGRYSLQLDDVVVPTVSIDEEPFEEKPAAAAVPLGGGGGLFGTSSLEAPGDGQTIVVIDQVMITPGPVGTTAALIGLYLTPSGGVGTGNGFWRDARIGGFPATLYDVQPPQAAFAFDPILMLPPDGTWAPVGITLPADPRVASKWALIFQAVDADTTANINVLWRELIPRRSNAPT